MSELGPPAQKLNSLMLWGQLLAGPILWSIHFLLSYLLVEAFCQMGWNFSLLGMNGLFFLVITFTILAVLGAALSSLRSYRSWQTLHAGRSLQEHFRDGSSWFEGPVDFMYFSGFLLSSLFAVTILMVGIPSLFLHPCS